MKFHLLGITIFHRIVSIMLQWVESLQRLHALTFER